MQDAGEVGAALGRLLTRLKVRCRLVALAVGGSSVLVKRFPAPRDGVRAGRGTTGFRDAVAREAARHVPFHLESLEFDYEGPIAVAPDGPPEDSPREEPGSVVFGAAPREVVEAHCQAAASAGRHVTRVELEPYALHAGVGLADRLAGAHPEPGAAVIVEIGASRCGVHVFRTFAPVPAGTPDPAGLPEPAGGPAELLASVPAPGAGTLLAHGPLRREESDGRRDSGRQLAAGSRDGRAGDTEAFRNRLTAAAREALEEAGLHQGFRLLLSGGGAAGPAVRLGLERLGSGAPAVLDPLKRLGRPECGPAYSVAAGLAYQQLLDHAGSGRGGRS